MTITVWFDKEIL